MVSSASHGVSLLPSAVNQSHQPKKKKPQLLVTWGWGRQLLCSNFCQLFFLHPQGGFVEKRHPTQGQNCFHQLGLTPFFGLLLLYLRQFSVSVKLGFISACESTPSQHKISKPQALHRLHKPCTRHILHITTKCLAQTMCIARTEQPKYAMCNIHAMHTTQPMHTTRTVRSPTGDTVVLIDADRQRGVCRDRARPPMPM